MTQSIYKCLINTISDNVVYWCSFFRPEDVIDHYRRIYISGQNFISMKLSDLGLF